MVRLLHQQRAQIRIAFLADVHLRLTLAGVPASRLQSQVAAHVPALALSERIGEYNERIEKLAQESYPQVVLLQQVKGVGTLIALTFLLTVEDPHRFRSPPRAVSFPGIRL